MKVCASGSRTEEVLKNENGGEDGLVESQGNVEESLRLIDDLKFFLATAPVNWQENQIIRRYYLNNDQGFVSCVFWNSLYYITGTDIVKCCMYRMQKFGREVIQKKKFEEGIFSDLRNLKCGVDATLEPPKSEFLSFLFRNLCLKTQKKQKVFFWFSVRHDELFADALERDLKRESLNQPSTTRSISEPSNSFKYDPLSSKPLGEQLNKFLRMKADEAEMESVVSDRMVVPERDVKFKTEGDASSPTKDIIEEPQHFTLQMDSSTDTQQDLSSPNTSANFEPQKLVIEPSTLELADSGVRTNKDDPLIIDDADRGDFPLDYFPVEIEYPHQERDFEVFNTRTAVSHLPPFYDNRFEEEVVPPTATYAFFPPYPIPTPFAVPLSGTRSQFVVNSNKYWASQPKERSLSPSGKDFPYEKDSEEEELDEGAFGEHNSSLSEHQQQVLYQTQAQCFNAYPKAYNGATVHGYYPQAAEMSLHSSENMSYAYDDLQPSQEFYDQGYLIPAEPLNWGFVPPQAMQPPTSGTGFVPRPFTPSFRSTPVTGRAPYISMAQNGWPQAVSSPYGSRSTSATTKTHPGSTMHQQQQRRQPFSGSAATSMGVSKHSKIVKPSHRRTSSQHKPQKVALNTKWKVKDAKAVDGENTRGNSDTKQQISIPTPESNTLVAQASDDGSAEAPGELMNSDDLQP